MANEQLELPDGTIVGTGLMLPLKTVSDFPLYEDSGPMLTMDQILEIAKSGKQKGRDKFDRTFIKNQRNHGSCQGFASALALTRARIRRGQPRVDLSGAYLYSLCNGGRDNGSMLDDGMEVVGSRGCCREELAKWNQIYRNQYDTQACDEDAKRFKGFECYTVRTKQALFSALASGFDCIVAVHADNGFMRLDSRGIAGGGQGPGNHAVGSDGIFFDGDLLADSYNSWDINYGDEGRMYLTWERHFAPTTKYHVLYAIRSTLNDPNNPTLPPAQE